MNYLPIARCWTPQAGSELRSIDDTSGASRSYWAKRGRRKVDDLLLTDGANRRSLWEHIKIDSGAPTLKEFRRLIERLQWLKSLRLSETGIFGNCYLPLSPKSNCDQPFRIIPCVRLSPFCLSSGRIAENGSPYPMPTRINGCPWTGFRKNGGSRLPAGALAVYLIAASYKAQIAYAIGAVFLCGGGAASFMIPAPTWFIALDLLAAYLPMAWLGIQIGSRMKHGKTVARKTGHED
jgi:hypothetical protein